MLQSRTGTGWKRPSERLEETEDRLADRRKRLIQSISITFSETTYNWLNKILADHPCLAHILLDLNLTFDLLTGKVGWGYPSQKQHASSSYSFPEPYTDSDTAFSQTGDRHCLRPSADPHAPILSANSMHRVCTVIVCTCFAHVHEWVWVDVIVKRMSILW